MKYWPIFVRRRTSLSNPFPQVPNGFIVRGNHELRSDFQDDRLYLLSATDYDTKFLSAIAAANGVSFTATCEIETDAVPEQAAAAFATYMAAMFAFVSWEKAWEAKFNDETPVSVAK
jgi:hypothetical protein